MALTESPPQPAAAPTAPAASPSEPATTKPVGLAGIVGTADHKIIGRLYIGASFLFMIASVVAGQLVAIDRVDQAAGDTILTEDTFFQVFTLHTVSGTFLFLLPLILGLALVVVPLQVGASTVAFPRAAAASFWVFIASGGLLLASYAINGGPGGGSDEGVGLWAVSFAAVVAALLLATVCVVTTVLALRAPGMTLDRAPLFSWSMVAGGGVWLLTLPVLVGALVLVYFDHRYGQVSIGAEGEIYPNVRWALLQSQVYAFAVPALGIIADIVATFSRARLSVHRAAMAAIGVFAVAGFGAYLSALENPEASTQPLFVVMAFVAILPLVVLLALFADTVRRGKVRLASPLTFAAAAFLMLGVSTLAGAAASVESLELSETVWVNGHAHYVLMAGVIAAVGGLHYWSTKVERRPLAEGAGNLAVLALLAGTVALSLPDLVSGLLGDGNDATAGIEAMNVLVAIGGGLVVIGAVVAVANVLGGVKASPVEVPADPWGGHTLEWVSPSPPPYQNFVEPLPDVTSEAPLLDIRLARDVKEGKA